MTQLSILSFMRKKNGGGCRGTGSECENRNACNGNKGSVHENKRNSGSIKEGDVGKRRKIEDSTDGEALTDKDLVGYFGEEWFELLKDELHKPYFAECLRKVKERRRVAKVYPSEKDMFLCFKVTPVSKISVVIIGQDPYHQPGQAMGLCFSVPKGVAIPPSLRNIYKEIGKGTPSHGDLTSWAKQGVLLLNSLLSVEEGRPMSHKDYGWDRFTSAVISVINKLEKPVVFMLWGRSAQAKASNVCRRKHLVLESAHPSPLSQKNFMGCGHFDKCNEFLRRNNIPEIVWIPSGATDCPH